MNKNLLLLGISRIEQITHKQIKMLLKLSNDYEDILKLPEEKVKAIGFTKEQWSKLLCINEDELIKYNQMLKTKGISFITRNDANYPKRLKDIYDAPFYIYVKGNISALNYDCVSIVGSRKCSKYGEIMAKKLAYNLAKQNKVVVSGMAKGIDAYAHKGCLNAGGRTIAVLGSGINQIYPKENENLYYEILSNGGTIISEYDIYEKPLPSNFPARNRIISGLSDKLIVVEAGEKSGTFITVDFALEQGKDIYAVPGNVTSYYSRRNK